MITLNIDQEEVTVSEGTTILEAAKQVHIKIPTLCHFGLITHKCVLKEISSKHDLNVL